MEDSLKEMKARADRLMVIANQAKNKAKELTGERKFKEANVELLIANRATTQAEELMHEYKRLGGV